MIKRTIIVISSLLVLFVVIASIDSNISKKENDKMWEERFIEYDNLWSNGSTFDCNLIDVDGFVVTETNKNKFKDPKIIVKIVDSFLYLELLNSKKEIQSKLVRDIREVHLYNEYKSGNDVIHPNITSILDFRLWNEEINLFNVHQYSCKKR